MKQKLVRIITEDLLELNGILYEGDFTNKKIVIHVHGLAGSFHENHFIDCLAKTCCDKNISFLTFNNRGSGYITDMIQGNTIKEVGAVNESFEDCVLDIGAAINYVKELGYSNIILSGHSYGCNKVIFSYDKFRDLISKIILLSPCDIIQEIKKGCHINFDDYIREAKNIFDSDKNGTIEFSEFTNGYIKVETLLTDFVDNSKLDFFKYNCPFYKSTILNDVNTEVAIIFGNKDSCVYTTHEKNIIDYLENNFSNCSIQIIDGGNHQFKNNFFELEKCINSVIK